MCAKDSRFAVARCSGASRRGRSTTSGSRRCRPCGMPRTSWRWRGVRWSGPRRSSRRVRSPRATWTLRGRRVTAAEAQLADAKSRLASADRQLADTVLRAPIDGIIAKKPVNTGDVVSVGDRAVHHHRPIVDAARSLGARRTICRIFVSARPLTSPSAATSSGSRAESMIAPQADPVDPPGADLRVDSQRRRASCRGTVRRRAAS